MKKTLSTAFKLVFITPLLLIFSSFVLFYIYNKVIKVPLIANIIYKDKPWKSYDGQTCNWGNCYTSEMNQKYEYWSKLAIQKRNAELCNNVEGQDGGDYMISKEEAINYCKESYGLELGDAQYCDLHSGERRMTCIINIDKKYPERNILTKEKCSNYMSSKVESTNCMTALAIKTNNQNFCYLLRQANYPSGEIKCLLSLSKNEKRADSLKINASVLNIKTSMQICNAYHLEANKFGCYSDIIQGIQNNDGYVPNQGYTILDQDCLDFPIKNEWEICLYAPFIINSNIQMTPDTPSTIGYNLRNTMQEKVRQKIINEAMTNSDLKSKLCRSIQWQTWGNNAIGEGPMKNFAVIECNLKDYLEKKDFFN